MISIISDFCLILWGTDQTQDGLFPDAVQEKYLRMTVAQHFYVVQQRVVERLAEKNVKNDDEILAVWITVIDERIKELEQLPLLEHVNLDYQTQVEQAVKDGFDNIVSSVFDDVKLPDKIVKKLHIIGAATILKNVFPGNISGVVFAGYGETEIFPSVYDTRMEGFFLNQLKITSRKQAGISFENAAAIVPFAQKEMVAVFMEGINPDYRQFVMSYVSKLLDNYRESLVPKLPGLQEKERRNLSHTLHEIGKNLIEDFRQEVVNYQNQTYTKPIIDNVQFLPIDELASMAEALVNLTSFKRHISSDSETVGGPIDVAVISKKDGFIWIKRKHYFRPELNQHFLHNMIVTCRIGRKNDEEEYQTHTRSIQPAAA